MPFLHGLPWWSLWPLTGLMLFILGMIGMLAFPEPSEAPGKSGVLGEIGPLLLILLILVFFWPLFLFGRDSPLHPFVWDGIKGIFVLPYRPIRWIWDKWHKWSTILPEEREALKLERRLAEEKARLERVRKGEYATSAKKAEIDRRTLAAIERQNTLREQILQVQAEERTLRHQEIDTALKECDLESHPSSTLHHKTASTE